MYDIHSAFCAERVGKHHEFLSCRINKQVKPAEWYTPATGAFDARNGN
jgi:hypothetical protein